MSFLQSFKHPLSVRTFHRTNTPPLPRHRVTVRTARQAPHSFNAIYLSELIEKRCWRCRRLFLVLGFTCCAILIRPFPNSIAVSRLVFLVTFLEDPTPHPGVRHSVAAVLIHENIYWDSRAVVVE
jgi:hypothetical protein